MASPASPTTTAATTPTTAIAATEQATLLLRLGMSKEVRLLSRSSKEMLGLLDTLEQGAGGKSGEVRKIAAECITTIQGEVKLA